MQVALLERITRDTGLEGVECLTIDKCQGRDKECVVVSFVRSNAEGQAGECAPRRCWAHGKTPILRNTGSMACAPLGHSSPKQGAQFGRHTMHFRPK